MMECPVYEQLEKDRKIAHEEWTYFYVPANKPIHFLSDGSAKRNAKEKKKKLDEINDRIALHQQGCAVCKR
jgi:hypothetical protein